ncbi:MAG: sulfite exporter TauE/SafE family protein [Candidatus Promineifilaceae bacterium]|jgi:hypothetical protein
MLPDYPTTFWIAAFTAVLIVGIAKAGFGGGIGFVATPLIALTISVADAAALLLPILIIIDLLSIRHYRGIYDRASLKLLLPSAVVGITLGALFFNALRDNDDMLRRALGLLAVLFVVYQVGRTAIMGALEGRRPGRPVGIFLGVLSGFGSTLAHAGGPPATMYLLPQKLPRQVFAGTAVWFFMAVNLIKLIPYAALGLLRLGNLTTILLLAPVGFVGVRLGIYLNQNFDQEWFNRIIYLFLFLTGLQLLTGGALTRMLLG